MGKRRTRYRAAIKQRIKHLHSLTNLQTVTGK